MGEYIHYINLDKKEFFAIVPFKFWENMAGEQPKVLLWLLTHTHRQMGLGWGDVKGYKYLGRWVGDRIIVLGDYDPMFKKLRIFDEYKDITCEVIKEVMDYAKNEGLSDLYKYLDTSYKIQCITINK